MRCTHSPMPLSGARRREVVAIHAVSSRASAQCGRRESRGCRHPSGSCSRDPQGRRTPAEGRPYRDPGRPLTGSARCSSRFSATQRLVTALPVWRKSHDSTQTQDASAIARNGAELDGRSADRRGRRAAVDRYPEDRVHVLRYRVLGGMSDPAALCLLGRHLRAAVDMHRDTRLEEVPLPGRVGGAPCRADLQERRLSPLVSATSQRCIRFRPWIEFFKNIGANRIA